MPAPHPLALAPESDAEVVARVCRGEVAAYEILMRRYNQRVFRTARAVLHDDDAAEDTAQKAWVSAYRNLAHFEGRSQFATWLLRITVNQASRDLRSNHSHLKLLEAQEHEPNATESPEAQAARTRLREILESAIDSLPEPLRLVLVLRDLEAQAAGLLALGGRGGSEDPRAELVDGVGPDAEGDQQGEAAHRKSSRRTKGIAIAIAIATTASTNAT